MITVIGGIKGGGGKTTLATNLCVMRSSSGKNVLLVDADEQKTASDWASQREALNIATPWTTIQLAGKSIHTELKKLMPHYDDIIVDVGGRDTTSQRSALAIANTCVIPFKPKSFDMWTLGAVKTMINEIRAINENLDVYAIVNQADSRGSDNDDSYEMIKEMSDFMCIPVSIGNRKAFANAASDGKSVVELKKNDPKATEEIKALYRYVFGVDYKPL
jgi:chromosome partitioning protein